MAYEVRRAAAVNFDLELIFDFLVASAEDFGETPEIAFSLAERRVAEIEMALEDLGRVPHQGTRREDLGADIRHVTKDRAIVYFDVDDDLRILRVLAVFFGGQDHDSRILLRILSGP